MDTRRPYQNKNNSRRSYQNGTRKSYQEQDGHRNSYQNQNGHRNSYQNQNGHRKSYQNQNIVQTQKVLAGRRTYFFDIKKTADGDHYLSITESKKKFEGEQCTFEKFSVLLYKEDLNKFKRAFLSATDAIQAFMPDYDFTEFDQKNEREPQGSKD